MKKSLFFHLLISLFALSIFSCSKEKEEDPKPDGPEVIWISYVASNNIISINWDKVEGATVYHVYFAEKGEALEKESEVENPESGNPKHSFSQVEADTEYEIRVEAYDNKGNLVAASETETIKTLESIF